MALAQAMELQSQQVAQAVDLLEDSRRVLEGLHGIFGNGQATDVSGQATESLQREEMQGKQQRTTGMRKRQKRRG